MSEVQELRDKVAALTTELEEKEKIIRQLQREVPGAQLKHERLQIPTKMLLHPETKDGEEYWTAAKVRDTFMSFFESKCGHTFWKSSPVVPHNDPTLLFCNAGMNQFKPVFLGQIDPSQPMSKLKRAVNSQKCIRAGGKHNDLEDVGKDVYHHTFFEMLGNWSFGDYFKQEAIDWAWELLTKVYKLPADRMYVTYFCGNDQVGSDEEAKEMWLKHLPASRVLPFDAKDNFWEMGDVGPCGPCSEIHFDRIGDRDAAPLVNMDDPNVVEIWNLVFMQFNRKPDGTLEKLPDCHVDTGMGFERILSALQNKTSNYDTDLFTPIFREIEAKSNVRPYQGLVEEADVGSIDMAYRVVADHIRTLTFAIADGAVPSNDGRGYVLRRVLRRAVRYSQDVLKMPKKSFSKLVSVVVSCMSNAFPEIKEKEKYIEEILMDEEATFERTLKKGVDFFTKTVEQLQANGATMVDGALAFKMYESMGFPLDLTQLMAEERGMTVDTAGYDACMLKHIEVSKKQKTNNKATFKPFEAKETSALEAKNIPKTTHSVYVDEDVKATIQALYDAKTEQFVDTAEGGQHYGVVLDNSSMYYESGGQVPDEGSIHLCSDASASVAVEDVQNAKGYIVHIGVLASGSVLKVGDQVMCCVDYARRQKVARNHTGTHIVNWALRKVLGGQIDQAGSLNTEDYLRFDFNSKKGLSEAQITEVELLVQKKIEAAQPVYTKVIPLEQTRKISALRAVFGETYPDPVRVVSVGASIEDILKDPGADKWFESSVELCGGTHVSNSSAIRKMVIISEEAKGKGIRRLVAYTDEKAVEAAVKGEGFYKSIEDTTDIKVLSEEIKTAVIPATMKKDLLALLLKKKMSLVEEEKKQQKLCLEKCIASIGDAPVQVLKLKDTLVAAPKLAKPISKKFPKKSFIIITSSSTTISIAVNVCKEHQPKLDANKWFKAVADTCGGKGGGRNGSVAGTGPLVAEFDKAVAAAESFASTIEL